MAPYIPCLVVNTKSPEARSMTDNQQRKKEVIEAGLQMVLIGS